MNHVGRSMRAVVLTAAGALVVALLPGGIATAAIAGPTGLAPDDANTWAKNVVLTWDEVGGAISYKIELSNDGFDTDSESFTGTSSSNRYVPPVDLPRGDYEWRVRAVTSTGDSDWSATANLLRGWDPSVAPSISQVSTDDNDWTVTWSAVPDASFYEVEMSPILDEPEDTGPEPYAKPDPITCFTTHTTFVSYYIDQPGEPTVADGAKCNGEVKIGLDYSIRVRGRDGTVDTRATDFAAPASSCTGIWQSLVGGASGPTPECTGWSNPIVKQVYGSLDEPSQVTGLGTSDVAGACDTSTDCTDVPVMSWDYDADADFYRVYLSRDRSTTDYDRLYENILGTTFQMADTFGDRSLPWYWRVQACNVIEPAPEVSTEHEAKCGPASAVSSFTIKNGKLPLAGASPTDPGPDFTTPYVDLTFPNTINGADHNAMAFQVQVSKTDDFKAPVRDVLIDQQAGDSTETTYRVDNLPDGTFFWRYRAVDQMERGTAWTQGASLKFTVDAAVPTVSIKTENGFGLTETITLTASKALVGANSNSMGVKLKDGTQLDGRIKQLTSTKWEFTPDTRYIPNAAYVPFVAPTVMTAGGAVAVSDNGIKRPTGLVDSKSSAMRKVDGDFSWATRSASDAVGKSYVAAKHKASNNKVPYVSVQFGGKSISLDACKSSANGLADIYLDGAKIKTIDLYRGNSWCGEVWSKSGLDDEVHTLKVMVVGKKSSDSSGTYVGVDAAKAG